MSDQNAVGSRSLFWSLLPILLLIGIAYLAPFWALDPHLQNLGKTLQAPNSVHWLGTDYLGRDLIARLMEAIRISLGLAIMSASFALVLGAALGWAAAHWGGAIEKLCSLVADGVVAIPSMLWVLLIAALAPGEKWVLYSGLVLTSWVEFYRFVRPTAKSVLLGQPVQAARLLGFAPMYVLRWYLWPALSASLLRIWSYAVAGAVLAIASLGFVSVGIRPPTAELGLMMTEAMPYYDEAPWLLIAPVIVLLVSVILLQRLAHQWARHLTTQPNSSVPNS